MNTEARVIRKRRTQAEIQELVAEFRGSGLKQSEFCRSRGLSWETLTRHLKMQKRKPRVSPVRNRLVQVEVAGQEPAGCGSTGLTLVLGKGRRIEVGSEFDAQTLMQLVQALERI